MHYWKYINNINYEKKINGERLLYIGVLVITILLAICVGFMTIPMFKLGSFVSAILGVIFFIIIIFVIIASVKKIMETLNEKD